MAQTDDPDTLRSRLQELKVEHRDLDTAIHHLMDATPSDELMMRRLKKRKLQLKDQIALIEGMLEPDIPA